MPLRYLLDEHLRGPVWHAIVRHNVTAIEVPALDVVRVGDIGGVPLGVEDIDILQWAAEQDRILVSSDRSTLARHLADHLAAGHRSPGVFLVRPGTRLIDLVLFLNLAAHASEPSEWHDRVTYIP